MTKNINEFCEGKVDWLNSRPFSAKEGSRRSVYETEERACMQPLPAERYEMCEWRSAKVSPDYHIVIDYMHYSVPHALIGRSVDARLTDSTVTVMHDGAVVAEHRRLRGRKGRYSTIVDHMPPAHAAMDSPWSPERFTSWARRIGPQTGLAIERVMAGRTIVEQSFVPCRNILGLSKTYTPELLERACGRLNELGALPSYTAVRNAILAIKAADRAAVPTHATPPPGGGPLEDRAKNAGRLRGADA